MKKLAVLMIGILLCVQSLAHDDFKFRNLILYYDYKSLPNGEYHADRVWLLDLTTLRYVKSRKNLLIEGGISVGFANGFWLANIAIKKSGNKLGTETAELLAVRNYAVYCDEGVWQYLGGVEYTENKPTSVRADNYISIPNSGTVGKHVFDRICDARELLEHHVQR